jgi:predicted  nucleic acid-binding Zn-ribbon protein
MSSINGDFSLKGQTQAGGVIDAIQGLSVDLQHLIAALQAEIQAKPAAPSTAGLTAADASKVQNKYQSDLTAWRGRVDKLEGEIEKVMDRIAKLQTSDLPAAQAADADRLKKAAEQAMKIAEAACGSKGGDGGSYDDAFSKINSDLVALIAKYVKGSSIDPTLNFARVP